MRSRRITMVAAGALVFSALSGAPAWAAGPFQVDTAADSVDANPGDGVCADGDGQCSLRAAVQEANASGGGEIDLQRAATYVLTVGGTGEDAAATGDLDVTSGISIEGRGATVDANGIDRVFHMTSGASLRVQDLTITGGVANGMPTPANSGGGVLNAGELVVDRSVVAGNTATRAGGGIEASAGSTTTVQRSTLSDNATGPGPGNGGGLHITASGEVTVDRSRVIGNTAAQEGGGLWNDAASTMMVSRSVISGNSADGAKADDGGGGLFNNGGTMTVDGSEVRGNTAEVGSGSGGGILNLDGTLTVERTFVDGNSAARAGGGIEASLGSTMLERITLSDNRTGPNPGNGGGLHLTGAGEVTLDRGSVTGNSAANEGGGLWNDAGGTMTVTRTTITGNSAPTGENVFQKAPDGDFSIDGEQVPPGMNDL